MHLGIIHVNQQDRNSGYAIWSRIANRDGVFEGIYGWVNDTIRGTKLLGTDADAVIPRFRIIAVRNH